MSENVHYSNLKNVQVIISLLKQYAITHIVISAGTRHTPLVHSIENNSDFTCYSIVDERSASFFALGLIEELKIPVAICCTSGTAACNYLSAAAEACYQQLPLLIITADRNPMYLFQQEEQMCPQQRLYQDFCKKEVTLPIVRDEKDFWYCSRLVNEALLELEHREKGPVHINYPVENDYPEYQNIVKFDGKELPEVRKIERLSLANSDEKWTQWCANLQKSKILVIYGQFRPLSTEEKQWIDAFCEHYNCVLSVDSLSNFHGSKTIDSYLLANVLSTAQLTNLKPDILITLNANSIATIKNRMISFKDSFKHWHVSAEGVISDPFKCLPDIVECDPRLFFKKCSEYTQGQSAGDSYYQQWKTEYDKIFQKVHPFSTPVEYSAVYGIQQFMKRLPENVLLHLGNSNSVRIASMFPIDSSVSVYCNRGTNGIDGSMSSFIGQSYVAGRTSYLLIGDLSFFYDMNALWNRYIHPKLRILVSNNSGGAIFHNYPSLKNIPTLDMHIAAEHHTSVKDWVLSRGFEYLAANDKTEFDTAIDLFVREDSDKPIVLEFFTDKETDKDAIRSFPLQFAEATTSLKRTISQNMSPQLKSVLKKIIK